jgi:hypothetical protein
MEQRLKSPHVGDFLHILRNTKSFDKQDYYVVFWIDGVQQLGKAVHLHVGDRKSQNRADVARSALVGNPCRRRNTRHINPGRCLPLTVSGKNLGEGHPTENHENTTHQIVDR